MSSLILLRTRHAADKGVLKIQTQIMSPITFSPANRAFDEIMYKNAVQPDRPQMAIEHGAYAMHAG